MGEIEMAFVDKQPPAVASAHFVFCASDFRVSEGVRDGEHFESAAAMAVGDQIRLSRRAQPRLLILSHYNGVWTVAQTSHASTPGTAVKVESHLTFMSPDGRLLEVLLLTEQVAGGSLHILPLGDIHDRTDYVLVDYRHDDPVERFEEASCAPFFEGTTVLMADGSERPIEEIQIGDMVQTVAHGNLPVRWCGKRLLAATGSHAPISVTADALGNDMPIMLSPRATLMVPGRSGRPSAMEYIYTNDLVNGDTIRRMDGQYMMHYFLRLAQPAVIIANGLMTTTRSAPNPSNLPRRMKLVDNAHDTDSLFGNVIAV
ncbi:Hint domain-containing protein [Palleronia caenipelagi]|uniref:Hedgehog/Intein (Hint) domain-containing protein n=1 Tax=Palleronia caenipelagi TaxID=2489174 RepID=A0A547Q553_9RHOB|nr:Hint domain-containing protein [Palleronia caenipelagi]TRD21522.1 hypothetical protein FEV53_08550 [Palleronia caenipelagi]